MSGQHIPKDAPSIGILVEVPSLDLPVARTDSHEDEE
jgi:hypothetical protein